MTYLDANNLYGWAMSQALPVDGFRWLEKDEFEHLNINYVSDDSEDGYILDVFLTSIIHRNFTTATMNIY
jgi:hypothetical protein